MSHNENLPTETSVPLDVVAVQERQIAIQEQQTKALTSLATSINALATFVTQGGLGNLLEGYSKIAAGNGILQGLVTHSGRQGLDARTMKQNGIEAFHAMNSMQEAMKERLREQRENPELSEQELHDAENEFLAWTARQKQDLSVPSTDEGNDS